MATLTFQFTNSSGVDDSKVFIGFVPGASGTSVTIENLADGSAIAPVDGGGTYPNPGNWYSLDTLASGVGISSFSGRIYVCYQQPWSVQGSGYEPAQAVTDANLFLRYDKLEITFTGQPADVANLTSIDYWSIPLSLIALKNAQTVQTALGLRSGVTAQDIFDALDALTTPPVSGVDGPGGVDGQPMPALVPGQFQQYGQGPAPGTAFARIIGPSSYPPIFPPPSAIPVMPYDLMRGYLGALLELFGPGTTSGAAVPGLGNGVIATIAGSFAGVGPNVPSSGPQSRQTYDLAATIDSTLGITLTGKLSGCGETTMVYAADDLMNPTGIYGGNAPFTLDGASTKTAPANDVYGWIGGDLFSGLAIGALGSTSTSNGSMVGSLPSQSWFELPVSSFFAGLQPSNPYYNQWAAALSDRSDAYNFAFTDRFAPVLVSLDPANVDTLQLVLEDGTVKMPRPHDLS